MGRHSAPDDGEDRAGAAGAGPSKHAGSSARSNSADDLHLLRTNSSLRARCAAAVAVPFLLYTLIMVVLAQGRLYLLWVWVPTVLAGILVGALLDQAHRRANRPTEPAASADQR
ncbi:MAG: hypothetical protein QOE97_1931 [Pseudonocardiales bacterium]|jgi:hypothetical protein|nr:hypothetical protein [Pseudonocardiales bacterium]